MIDKVEKVTRIKGAVYDVRRRDAKDGEGRGKKETFKRMLESAMDKKKGSREAEEEDAAQKAYALDLSLNRATQSLFYADRQPLDLGGLVERIHA